jgi:hypothetical protein
MGRTLPVMLGHRMAAISLSSPDIDRQRQALLDRSISAGGTDAPPA